MTDRNREELRRALIWAEHEWPGNLERRIDAIPSVFEQAHAPTSDEWEWLISLLLRSREWNVADRADAILAAGFRRTVQGEPTQEERDAGLSEAHSESYRLGWRAGRASVQGEPTDAQVIAALNAYQDRRRLGTTLGDWGSVKVQQMRAALRAAAENNEREEQG